MSGDYRIIANNGVGSPVEHTFRLQFYGETRTTADSYIQPTEEGAKESQPIKIVEPLPTEIYTAQGAAPTQLDIRVTGEPLTDLKMELTLTGDSGIMDLAENAQFAVKTLTANNAVISFTLPVTLPGTLKLKVSNKWGGDTTISEVLVEESGQAPYFDPTPPEVVRAYPESGALLRTRVRGTPDVQVDWFFLGSGSVPRPIDDSWTVHRNGSLSIDSLTSPLTGQYLVMATNEMGAVSGRVQLEITYSAGEFAMVTSVLGYHSYTDWTAWSTCTAECAGQRSRFRTCSNPPPKAGYPSCPEEREVEVETCGAPVCPGFSEWSTWSSCSKNCGYGTRDRTRECDSPAPVEGGPKCTGLPVQTEPCYLAACSDVVNGQWTEWGDWGDCSADCGSGTQRRERTCTNPAPSGGGVTCEGSGHEERPCVHTQICQRSAAVTTWSQWSGCSAECGGGIQNRSRGDSTQMKDCNVHNCNSRRKRVRSVSMDTEPENVPVHLSVSGEELCLSGKLLPGASYTLLDTDNVQIYGTLKKNGLYKSVTIYAGSTQLDSITITPTDNRRLPGHLGPLRINTKSDKVTVRGDGLVMEIRTVDSTGLRVSIEQESANTGLLGALIDLTDSLSIIKKNGDQKVLKKKNKGYLLTRSTEENCLTLSSSKYNKQVLGELDQFRDNDN
eukprot:sb/3462746/